MGHERLWSMRTMQCSTIILKTFVTSWRRGRCRYRYSAFTSMSLGNCVGADVNIERWFIYAYVLVSTIMCERVALFSICVDADNNTGKGDTYPSSLLPPFVILRPSFIAHHAQGEKRMSNARMPSIAHPFSHLMRAAGKEGRMTRDWEREKKNERCCFADVN